MIKKKQKNVIFLPTIFIGFNVEAVEYKNIKFTVWDIDGQDKVINIPNFNFLYFIFYTLHLHLIQITTFAK